MTQKHRQSVMPCASGCPTCKSCILVVSHTSSLSQTHQHLHCLICAWALLAARPKDDLNRQTVESDITKSLCSLIWYPGPLPSHIHTLQLMLDLHTSSDCTLQPPCVSHPSTCHPHTQRCALLGPQPHLFYACQGQLLVLVLGHVCAGLVDLLPDSSPNRPQCCPV